MLLQYILKLSISISVVYLFYQLLLRRLTFYNLNRWYLLIYSMLCLVIPFINVFTLVAEPALQRSAIIRYIPAIEQMTTTYEAGVPVVEVDEGINYMQLIIMVIGAGIVFMILRLLVQYYSLFKLRSKAVLLYNDNVKLYHIDKPIVPFSFGKSIYINQGQHSEDELKEIIRHEFIHVKQRHSADIIWSELLCIINWYNPFAWLLRKAMRQNLEFIADEQVLQTGFDRKQYQYLLLKVIGVRSFSIATNFNFSSLKKRIAMMNKTKTARVHLIRFLLMLPLLMVVLLAFRNTVQQQRQQQPLRSLATDTIPAAPIAPKLPDEVVTIDINNDQATIRLKNGQIEKYNLSNAKEKKAFESKYGAVPKPPVPPTPPTPKSVTPPEPPVPPAPPVKEAKAVTVNGVSAAPAASSMEVKEVRVAGVFAPPVKELKAVTVTGMPAPAPASREVKEVFATGYPSPNAAQGLPHPVQVDCITPKGYCITIADNNGECVVIVKDRQKKIVEAVTLNDWNKDSQYAAKYGEIPVPADAKTGAPIGFAKPKAKSKSVLAIREGDIYSVVSRPNYSIKTEAQPAVKQQLKFEITKNTTIAWLEETRKELALQGYEMKIGSTNYSNGVLKSIELNITGSDGSAVTLTAKDLTKGKAVITITQYENKQSNYFIRSERYELFL